MVTSWKDIGGLEDCIQEIQESVIMPFRRQELFSQSTLLQPPKGKILIPSKTIIRMFSITAVFSFTVTYKPLWFAVATCYVC